MRLLNEKQIDRNLAFHDIINYFPKREKKKNNNNNDDQVESHATFIFFSLQMLVY